MIGAIISDTWEQSKQQGVFIAMLVIMALLLVGAIALPKVFDEGSEKAFGLAISDQPSNYFAQQWINVYASTLGMEEQSPSALLSGLGGNNNLSREQRREQAQQFQQQLVERQRVRREAVEAADNLSNFQRSVEYYINVVVGAMFTVSLLFFIAACAGYFPAMLSSGAVDIVLSKPISRLKIFLGKYVGGITLFAAAIVAFNTLLYVGIGLRTGVWHERIFLSLPLLIFTAMVLYAVLALIGTWSKSATMALILGYVLYLVVDSLVGVLLDFQPVFQELGWESVADFCSVLRTLTPNFGNLKDLAVGSVLNIPAFQVAPFITALAWLFICLGLGYWIFARRDY